ncbi:winged helix-turn-helix transcriptional regulator [Formosa sediminum]|uniref:Winged helix-turn-helix transcriptional regulator n=1 Tax=Formosa sediminum TaxID=2594004 RepID=A0A516GNT1_9FLAO|nr:metalloregulator ArsR/SmtB family transcription factor [Formosa sediminum]QDO93165.1 winged helix-turn-helix transcriptional regulator [Formosa sediminum]
MKTSIENSISVFKALSEITRLKIIWLLINVDSKICVSEIIDVLNVPQYNVSRHLRILSKAGILNESKEGKWVYYFINNTDSEFLNHIKRAVSTISENDMKTEIKRCKQKLLIREN